MSYSQTQINKANETDLAEFLLSQGEELIKSGREYRWNHYFESPLKSTKNLSVELSA